MIKFENVSLKALNTFGFDILATELIEIHSEKDILELYQNGQFNQPYKVIGGGSNLLLTQNLSQLVLHNKLIKKELVSETETTVTVHFGAGENWHDAVMYCVNNGWGGIENLSLIPGSVGAAPIQNIGAYGVEIKDTFESLRAFNTKTGEFRRFYNLDCRFGYRDSYFKQYPGEWIICYVAFTLSKNPKINSSYGDIQQILIDREITSPKIKDISDAVIAIRSSKLPDPKDIGNSGSFFKNPVISKSLLSSIQQEYPNIKSFSINETQVKIAAGWLIETAGWKGYKEGNVGVHKNQALVLVHYGGGEGSEIKTLAEKIQRDIYNKFQIHLEFEVNIW